MLAAYRALCRHLVGFGWDFVLGTDVAARDSELARAINADEGSGARAVARIETEGPLLKASKCRLDLGEALTNFVRQFCSFHVGFLEPIVFGLKGIAPGPLFI